METSHLHIRFTRPEEAELLPVIEQSAGERFRTIPELAWLADDSNLSAEAHLEYVRKGTSWVAEADGQLVGFLAAEVTDNILHIWEFDIRHEWQGKGIGRKLLNTGINYARNNGLQAVTLTTFRDVAWNERFYLSFGFETLDTTNLAPRLELILQEETKQGLPRNQRCAMRLLIPQT